MMRPRLCSVTSLFGLLAGAESLCWLDARDKSGHALSAGAQRVDAVLQRYEDVPLQDAPSPAIGSWQYKRQPFRPLTGEFGQSSRY